jgi:hypothetical protein
MVEFTTSPKGKIAAAIFDQAKDALGVAKAGQWMFTANTWLGGRTPIQAIRQGDEVLARRAADQLRENMKKAA